MSFPKISSSVSAAKIENRSGLSHTVHSALSPGTGQSILARYSCLVIGASFASFAVPRVVKVSPSAATILWMINSPFLPKMTVSPIFSF